MKRAVLGLAAALLSACTPQAIPSGPGPHGEGNSGAAFTPPEAAESEIAALVERGNRFSVDLYRQVAGTPGNTIISPVSVSGAFALVQPGARAETASELAAVFGFDAVPPERFADAMGALLADLETQVLPLPQPAVPPPENSEDFARLKADPAATFSIASAGWIKTGFTPQAAYRETLKRAFNADIADVDFSAPPKAAATINAWVAAKTNDRITDLVDASGIDPVTTRLILTNAVWFRAKWRDAFDPDSTLDGDFFGRDGAPMPARLMNRRGDMPYHKGEGFSAVALDYTHPDFALTILLPDRRSGLAALEAKMSTPDLLAALDAARQAKVRDVILTIPKLTVDGRFELADAIQALGAPRAFTPGVADFSGMIETPEDLFIDQVTHVTWFQMDETQTEAAAATSVEIVATSAPFEEEKPVIFRADHPFLIALRHKPTGAILFLGRVEAVKPG